MQKIVLFSIYCYQKIAGFLKKEGIMKDSCVFYPTCSQYAVDAIQKYGIFKGVLLATRRLSRCHPWQKDHIDPIV